MAKVILLVITVTAASARHINNDRHLVQPVNSEVNVGVHSDQLVQRRNIEYGIGVNNVPRKHEVSYHYYHIQDPSIVQNQENINADSYNYIGNENDFRLKTNLHQSEGRKIENSNGGSTLTNVKTKIDNNDRKEPCRRVTTTQRVSVILPTEYEGTLKTNVNTLNDRRNMTSTRGSNKTSGEASTNRPAQNAPKESQLPKTEERKLGMPQENENETWVWGMDEKRVTESTATSVRTLPDDDELDDRVALAGDKCPTGFAKISGKCVEKL